MRINGSSFDPLRPNPTAPNSNPATQRPAEQGGQSSGSVKSDSVQFSDAGRSLAGRLESDQQAQFEPAKVAEMRTKVLNGAYNTLDVVDQVARRIIARGDL
jgi:anti-sigma28 factor (negative regulator of flagellin synthesis)